MSTFSVVHDLLSGIENAPSGTAAFYLPSTLTPITIYADSSGTATTNPVTLDSTGRATIYLTQLARMIVQTTGGVAVVDTVINASGDTTVANSSSAFTGATQKDVNDSALVAFGGQNFRYVPSLGAGGMLPKTWMTGVHYDVLAYAATTAPTINDGVTPADTAIAAALAAASAGGGGIVYFAPGTYLCNSQITVPSNNIQLVGSGWGSTTIKATGAAQNAIVLSSRSMVTIENLAISHSATSTGAAISVSASSYILIENVRITPVYKFAVDYSGACQNLWAVDCSLTSSGAGGDRAVRYTLSGASATSHVIRNCTFLGGSAAIEYAGTTSHASVQGCEFGAAFTSAIVFTAGLTGTGFNVSGCPSLAASTVAFDLSAIGTDPLLRQWGNEVDGYTSSFATGTTQQPLRYKGYDIRLQANSGGAGTVTVSAPTPVPTAAMRGVLLWLRFGNALGGAAAVTWNLNPVYRLVGGTAPSGTDATTVQILLEWDPDSAVWRELTRGQTTT